MSVFGEKLAKERASNRRVNNVIGFLALIGLAFTFWSACHTIQPPVGPGTEYPCGVWGVECSNHQCCPYKHVCGEPAKGTFNTCPEGYCCYTGEDDWPRVGTEADGGPRKYRSIIKAKPERP